MIKNNSTCFYVIGIDPGINHMGLSVSLIDYESKKILETKTTTIHVKEKNLNKDAIELFGLRQAKIDYLNSIFEKYLEQYNPITVVVESPFYNMRRPAAFLPLVELLYQLRMTLRLISPNSNFKTYEPSTIKKSVGAGAICKKDEVKVHVLKHKDIFNYISEEVEMEDLDEHSIDSLAVIYTHLKLTIEKI